MINLFRRNKTKQLALTLQDSQCPQENLTPRRENLSLQSITWRGSGQWRAQESKIPQKIWAYWDDTGLPKLVEACATSWRRHNPSYEINLLTKSTIRDFLPDAPESIFDDGVHRRADWLRLALLRRYGGIWLDATTIVRGPLDFISEAQQICGSDFVGYYIKSKTKDMTYPLVENWFLASPPGGWFVEDWYHEFMKSVVHGSDQYIRDLRSQVNLDDVRHGIEKVRHFSMHIAGQMVLRRQNSHCLLLFKAEDDPFLLQSQARWDGANILKRLTDIPASATHLSNLVKLRGIDWTPVEEKAAAGTVNENSLIGHLMHSHMKFKEK